ncbi:hypothetical protein Tco_1402124 [Tanacetum coccineum]
MADNRTMAQLLQAPPTDGYRGCNCISEINANFELKARNFNSDVASLLPIEVSELKNLMKTILSTKQKSQAPATVKAVRAELLTCGRTSSTTPLVPQLVVSTPLKKPEQKNPGGVGGGGARSTAKKTVQEPNSPEPDSYQPKLPYPERMKVREKDTPSAQQSRFMKLFKQLRLEIGLKDALIEMPKFNKWLSTLLRNKEKLEEIAITTVNAECSAIILNKVPEKLEDPGKFLIPPPITLELANRLRYARPSGIAEDVKKSEKSKNKQFAHAISVIDFLKDEPFSGSTTIHSDALPPSSSPVKTSDNPEEFTDELTHLKKGVQEENFQVYSNPLFEFDDNFNSSNENPLFDEMVEDVKNENSNVSNSDEPVLLNTPLSDKVECSDPEVDIDEIDAFLAMEVSSNFEEGYYDSEGDVIFLESLFSDYTTHNLSPEVIFDHEPKQNESIHNTSITFSLMSDPFHHEFAGEIITLPSRITREHEEYLSLMTLLCEISTSQSPESVKNDDSEDENNYTFLPEHESPNLDHQDNPSAPQPPPEPPNVKIRLEPDTAVINNFDVLNKETCFNLEEAGGVFNGSFLFQVLLSLRTNEFRDRDRPTFLKTLRVHVLSHSTPSKLPKAFACHSGLLQNHKKCLKPANMNTGMEELSPTAKSREEAIKVKP